MTRLLCAQDEWLPLRCTFALKKPHGLIGFVIDYISAFFKGENTSSEEVSLQFRLRAEIGAQLITTVEAKGGTFHRKFDEGSHQVLAALRQRPQLPSRKQPAATCASVWCWKQTALQRALRNGWMTS